MERCTIHRFKMRTLQKSTFCEFQGIENKTVRLCDLADFDQPVIKTCRWGVRQTAVTVHITPLLAQTFFEENPEFWLNQMTLFAIIWVLAERNRAFRLQVALAYHSSKATAPFELLWTLDFIEFGVKEMTPNCIVELSKTLSLYSPSVYETLHRAWPNYSSKISDYESFWIPVQSGIKPSIEITRTEPTWLGNGDKLLGVPIKTHFQWMDQIIMCFTLLARMHPEFGIVLKKVQESDTQLIFFVKRGDLYYFRLLLDAIDSVPKKMDRQKKSPLVITEGKSFPKTIEIAQSVHDSLSVVPFCRNKTLDMLRQAINNFKTGKPVMGVACMAGATVNLFADVGQVLLPIAKAVLPSKTGKTACKTIGQVTHKAQQAANLTNKAFIVGDTISQIAQPSQAPQARQVAQTQKSQKKNAGAKTAVNFSDEGLLRRVFPLMAQDILGA